jgi:phosphatidylserine/phosphatidylglycerophosphate/cardiolipin synthase-like enzyme
VAEYAWHAAPDGIVRLAEAIHELQAIAPEDVARIASVAHDPAMRHETAALLERWSSCDAGSPAELAAFLAGAAEAVRIRSTAESADLVWSGPASETVPLRRSDEALLEVVCGARQVLTIVTFAAYRIPDVRGALEQALDRGVEVRFVGESEEASDGSLRFDAVLALGEALARRSLVLEWPRELRPRDPRGFTGRLHAKCALADDSLLLVSSANLTEAALGTNMEMGVLLRGGPIPRLAARHFQDLMTTGTLRPIR